MYLGFVISFQRAVCFALLFTVLRCNLLVRPLEFDLVQLRPFSSSFHCEHKTYTVFNNYVGLCIKVHALAATGVLSFHYPDKTVLMAFNIGRGWD